MHLYSANSMPGFLFCGHCKKACILKTYVQVWYFGKTFEAEALTYGLIRNVITWFHCVLCYRILLFFFWGGGGLMTSLWLLSANSVGVFYEFCVLAHVAQRCSVWSGLQSRPFWRYMFWIRNAVSSPNNINYWKKSLLESYIHKNICIDVVLYRCCI